MFPIFSKVNSNLNTSLLINKKILKKKPFLILYHYYVFKTYTTTLSSMYHYNFSTKNYLYVYVCMPVDFSTSRIYNQIGRNFVLWLR